MMAYMMRGTDGASRTPKELALVIKPIDLDSGYPTFKSRGNIKPPKARMVTPLPPVKAVKQLHKQATAKMLPRCPEPKNAVNNWLSLRAACVLAKINPARVKRGSAGSDGLTVIW